MQQPNSEKNAHKTTPPRSCLCGEEISKGKLGSAIVTMDACNSEKLSELNIEPPDDIERNISDWFFQTSAEMPFEAYSDICLTLPYPASTNKEPLSHLSKQQSHTSCFTSWSRGHNLQSVHHNSSTKPGHPHAQSAPTSY